MKLSKRQLQDQILTTAMGLDPEEIALAIRIMDKQGDNTAEFGINKCFIFSSFDIANETLQ